MSIWGRGGAPERHAYHATGVKAGDGERARERARGRGGRGAFPVGSGRGTRLDGFPTGAEAAPAGASRRPSTPRASGTVGVGSGRGRAWIGTQ